MKLCAIANFMLRTGQSHQLSCVPHTGIGKWHMTDQ
jgi:hypothetical protein